MQMEVSKLSWYIIEMYNMFIAIFNDAYDSVGLFMGKTAKTGIWMEKRVATGESFI